MVVVETRCVILLGSRNMAGSGLATVMFTDLVGSTRMRERLGDDVADEIGVEHDRIIGDSLSSTGGRLVKNLGDGALAVFDSSIVGRERFCTALSANTWGIGDALPKRWRQGMKLFDWSQRTNRARPTQTFLRPSHGSGC
jgi:class 3 adenylate cyclase